METTTDVESKPMTHPSYNPTSSVKFYTFLTNNLDLNGYSTELCNLKFKPEEGHWYLTIRVSAQERYHGIVAFFVLGLANVSANGNRAEITHRSVEFGTYTGDDPDLGDDALFNAGLYLDGAINRARAGENDTVGTHPGQCDAYDVARAITGAMELAGLRTGVKGTTF